MTVAHNNARNMAASRYPDSIRPLKIHKLLAMQTEWTEDLWDETVAYLLSNISTADAILMVASILDIDIYFDFKSSDPPKPESRVEYIEMFRAYPPSVLLGGFDVVRRDAAEGRRWLPGTRL